MFITVKRHHAEMADLRHENDALDRTASKYMRQRDEALAVAAGMRARAEAAEAKFAMKHRKRDDKGHFLPVMAENDLPG